MWWPVTWESVARAQVRRSLPPTWALADRPAGVAGTVVSRCTTIAGEAGLVPWGLAGGGCDLVGPGGEGSVVSRCTTIAGEAALVPWVLAAVACNWLAPVSKVSARLNRPSPATVISPPLARPLTSS